MYILDKFIHQTNLAKEMTADTLHLHLSWHLLTFENPLYYFKSFETDVSHFRYIPMRFCLTSNIPCASIWSTRAMTGCKYHASWKRKRLWWLSMAGRGKWRLATYFIRLLLDLFFCLLSFALVSSFLKGILTKVIINQKNVKRINRSWLGGTAFLCKKEPQRNRVTITWLCREIRLWELLYIMLHISTQQVSTGGCDELAFTENISNQMKQTQTKLTWWIAFICRTNGHNLGIFSK